MAIKALVDNNTRYAVNRGGVTFPAQSKGEEFLGSVSSFAQVKACSDLRVTSAELVEDSSLTYRILPDLSKAAGHEVSNTSGMAAHPAVFGGVESPKTSTEGQFAAPSSDVTDQEPEPDEEDDPEATEDAKTLAEKEGVDLNEVTGTGAEGRVRVGDVRDYIEKRDKNLEGGEE